MPARHPFVALPRIPAVLLVLVFLVIGCGRQSPASPTSDSLMVSGYVYQQMTPDSGEPPIANVSITLRDENGAESTVLSDRNGFYRIPAATGAVTVRASKEGYETRESRFDITDDTVLNFSLTPLAR